MLRQFFNLHEHDRLSKYLKKKSDQSQLIQLKRFYTFYKNAKFLRQKWDRYDASLCTLAPIAVHSDSTKKSRKWVDSCVIASEKRLVYAR